MTRDLTKAYVHCPTQEDYDRYIKFLEENTDWKRHTGSEIHYGGIECECDLPMCVHFKREISIGRKEYFEKIGYGPCLSVDEAIEELKKRFSIDDTPMYKEGEMVMCSNDGVLFFEGIYLSTVPGKCINKYAIVTYSYEEDYDGGEEFTVHMYKHVKPLPKTPKYKAGEEVRFAGGDEEKAVVLEVDGEKVRLEYKAKFEVVVDIEEIKSLEEDN